MPRSEKKPTAQKERPAAEAGPGELVCAPVIRAGLSPEFEELYLDLAEIYQEDLSDEIVLNELADFMTDLLVRGGHEDLLERSCEVLEQLATDPLVDATSTVYGQVLACLSPAVLDRARPYLGPAVEELLGEIERD